MIELNIKALDDKDRNVLFLMFPSGPVPYRDTILLPYHPGAFAAAMRRIHTEISVMLRPDADRDPEPGGLRLRGTH